jgi:hypothetical protein
MNARDNSCNALLTTAEQLSVSGGGYVGQVEVFPVAYGIPPLYVKIGGHWVPTGTEPYIPVDLDGEHTPNN